MRSRRLLLALALACLLLPIASATPYVLGNPGYAVFLTSRGAPADVGGSRYMVPSGATALHATATSVDGGTPFVVVGFYAQDGHQMASPWFCGSGDFALPQGTAMVVLYVWSPDYALRYCGSATAAAAGETTASFS